MYDMESILQAQSLFENSRILKQGDYTLGANY